MENLEYKGAYKKFNDDEEKEIYLKEIEKSLHRYIRGEVKNNQLEELKEYYEEFQEKYEKIFSGRELVQELVNNIIKINKEVEESYKEILKNNEGKEELELFNFDIIGFDYKEAMTEMLNESIQYIIKDVVYLSHMNLMYDLYEKEEDLKRIEHEYDIITDKYQDLSKIMEIIRVNKRMDFEVILKEENIAREDLDELLMRNEKYFNIRKQRSKMKISLSPEGRKYLYYLENRKGLYSKKELNDIIHKNVYSIYDSIDNSIEKEIQINPKLYDLDPELERIIRNKQSTIMGKIVSKIEPSYNKNYVKGIARREMNEIEIYHMITGQPIINEEGEYEDEENKYEKIYTEFGYKKDY